MNPPLPPLLFVDDEKNMRLSLQAIMADEGYEVRLAESAEEALKFLQEGEFFMVITDARLGGMSGYELLKVIRTQRPSLPVLLITAYATPKLAVEAIKSGAIDYLAKPFAPEELLHAVARCAKEYSLLQENAALRARAGEVYRVEHIIGESAGMAALRQLILTVAPTNATVLILGESGTGKELIAGALHCLSNRRDRNYIRINCAAIPETLLESELFGHEKGAFTGAVAQRIGHFEAASAGTIFLDEVAEMSPQLQAKLLRVTQDGWFQRVGSSRELRTRARVLAATNRNLDAEVGAGRFREDLFYRLNVVELNVPSLRERTEDIVPLACLFIAEFTGGRARFASGVTECLERYSWPGNVRELRNAMERAALLSRGELILPEHLPARVRSSAPEPAGAVPDPRRLEEIELEAIASALRKHDFNRTEAAKALGISRRALVYKLGRLRALGYPVDPA